MALQRLMMLRSAKYRKRTAMVAGIGFAGLLGAAAHFMWGGRLAAHFGVQAWIVTVIATVVGFVFAWQLLRERIRPIEEIPSSRFVRWMYAARLRQPPEAVQQVGHEPHLCQQQHPDQCQPGNLQLVADYQLDLL